MKVKIERETTILLDWPEVNGVIMGYLSENGMEPPLTSDNAHKVTTRVLVGSLDALKKEDLGVFDYKVVANATESAPISVRITWRTKLSKGGVIKCVGY
jgi:hypothetical protein